MPESGAQAPAATQQLIAAHPCLKIPPNQGVLSPGDSGNIYCHDQAQERGKSPPEADGVFSSRA